MFPNKWYGSATAPLEDNGGSPAKSLKLIVTKTLNEGKEKITSTKMIVEPGAGVSNADLQHIAKKYADTLHAIDIMNPIEGVFVDVEAKILPTMFSNLKDVEFADAAFVNSDFLSQLAKCPNLEYVNISGCREINVEHVEKFLQQMKDQNSPLKQLNVSDVHGINENSVGEMVQNGLCYDHMVGDISRDPSDTRPTLYY